jgi:hypothetical protein
LGKNMLIYSLAFARVLEIRDFTPNFLNSTNLQCDWMSKRMSINAWTYEKSHFEKLKQVKIGEG